MKQFAGNAAKRMQEKEPSGILLPNDQTHIEDTEEQYPTDEEESSESPIAAMNQQIPWAGAGPIIRELRRGRGIRLKAIATATGLSVGYLSRLERNEPSCQNPGMANLQRIAQALEIPVTLLLPPLRIQPTMPEQHDLENHELEQNDMFAPATLREQMVGREVLLIVTYQQPTTVPVIVRSCQGKYSNAEILAALQNLVQRGLIRAVPPAIPRKPILFVIEYERNI